MNECGKHSEKASASRSMNWNDIPRPASGGIFRRNGYAVTSHSSQGQTADRVLIHVDSEGQEKNSSIDAWHTSRYRVAASPCIRSSALSRTLSAIFDTPLPREPREAGPFIEDP